MADSQRIFDPAARLTDANGNPLSGGKAKFYAANTSNPLTIYSDAELTTAIGTVVIADAGGYPEHSGAKTLIWTGTAPYKVVITDASDVTVATHDNIKGALDTSTFSVTYAIATTPVIAKTAAYTTTVADKGKHIACDPTGGAFAVSLLSAIDAGDGYRVVISHNADSANPVTVAPTANQKVGNKSGIVLERRQSVTLACDGANWRVESDRHPFFDQAIIVVARQVTPPNSPTPGARYLVNGTPTGAWLSGGFANKDIAEADGSGSWIKWTPPTNCGWLAYIQGETLLTQFRTTSWVDLTNITAPNTSTLSRAVFEHQLANATAGGTAVTGAWTARVLNTIVTNGIGASMASNQVTLPVGSYFVLMEQDFRQTDSTLSRLKTISGTVDVTELRSMPALFSAADGLGDNLPLAQAIVHGGFITVTATAVVELQYYCQSAGAAGSLGLGSPSLEPDNDIETYARLSVLSLTSLQGPQGLQGAQGVAGTNGAAAGLKYVWTTATSGDPGSGKMGGDAAAASTVIRINETDNNGGANATLLATWDDSDSTIKARLRIEKSGTPGTFFEFNITGASSSFTGYRTFPVSARASNGVFANGDTVFAVIDITGDKGTTGAAGAAGPTGATGPNGALDYAFNTATSGDPGSGKVLVNNATPASVTLIAISKTGRTGEANGGYIATFDDATTTSHRGHLRVFTLADRTKFFELEITGDGSDFGTYFTFPVTVSSSGTLPANADVLVVDYARTGNRGADGTGAGTVIGPSVSEAHEVATYTDTTGTRIERTGYLIYTPTQFLAVGDGAADDTTPLNNMINAVNAAGGGAQIVISRRHKVTAGLSAITTDNVDIVFTGKGELIGSGATSIGNILTIGQFMSALTSRNLTAPASRYARSLTFNDVTGMTVGNLLRLDWTNIVPTTAAFVSRIVSVAGNVVTLSHPIPDDFTTSPTFFTGGVTCAAPVRNVNIRNGKFSTSGYTGLAISPYVLRCADKCLVEGTRSSGFKSGGISITGAVDCTIRDHVGDGDGATGAGGAAAVSVYAATGCRFESIRVRNCAYFGVNLNFVHHSAITGIKVQNAGSLAQFVRGFEPWFCSNNTFSDIQLTDVFGAGVFLENMTRDNVFSNIVARCLKPTSFVAQSIATNGTFNTDNVWVNCWSRGTDATGGGSDFAIALSDARQMFLNATYDTIVISEPTTNVIRHTGEWIGPRAPAGANPNLLINGDFQINQRAFAGGALGNEVYGWDLWKGGSSCNATISGYVVTLTAGNLNQIVELATWGLTSLASTTVTVSVEAPSADMTVTFGTSSGTITAGSGRQSVTFTTGAGDAGNLTCIIAKATAGTVTFGRVKLELGSATSAWQPRPGAEELTLCKRCYQRIGGIVQFDLMNRAYQLAGLAVVHTMILPVEMRATPTAAKIGTFGVVNCGQPTVSPATAKTFRLFVTATVSGDTYYYSQDATTYMEFIANP